MRWKIKNGSCTVSDLGKSADLQRWATSTTVRFERDVNKDDDPVMGTHRNVSLIFNEIEDKEWACLLSEICGFTEMDDPFFFFLPYHRCQVRNLTFAISARTDVSPLMHSSHT